MGYYGHFNAEKSSIMMDFQRQRVSPVCFKIMGLVIQGRQHCSHRVPQFCEFNWVVGRSIPRFHGAEISPKPNFLADHIDHIYNIYIILQLGTSFQQSPAIFTLSHLSREGFSSNPTTFHRCEAERCSRRSSRSTHRPVGNLFPGIRGFLRRPFRGGGNDKNMM